MLYPHTVNNAISLKPLFSKRDCFKGEGTFKIVFLFIVL